MRVKLEILAFFGCLALAFTVNAQPFAPCGSCHEDLAKAFARNVHALAAPSVENDAVCASCHGDGAAHAGSGDPALIKVPRGAEGEGVCLSCHGREEGFWVGVPGVHSRAGLACESCHKVHAAKDQPLLAVASRSLCSPCHRREEMQFRKPFAHKTDRGGMECVSCHNPHGGKGQKSLKETKTGDTVCVSCHVNLRGPFVFEHGAVATGDCTRCHQPHGSNNPKQLVRARVDLLCLECHSSVGNPGVGSQPPSFHDLRSPRYQNCTTCHVTIHGSSSSPMFLR
ncbi:MAG: DmsE family decaheme c-type cytochrome [Thermoanaerobaculum sp.]|nr:DmsE family decaheme c-type cytochrome [Thermoanaerobaculum sp.]